MDSSDLKKLITGFLLLSALSGSATLILLNFTDTGVRPASSNSIGAEPQSPFSIGKNAFVEQLPRDSFSPQSGQAMLADNSAPSGNQTVDSSNLTQNFSHVFAQQVLAHNPDGPQTDSNGKPTALNLPNEDAAAALIQQAITSSTFAVDENIPNSDIRVLAAYTREDAKKYFETIDAVLADAASSTRRIDAANQSSTEENIALSRLIFEAALEKLKSAAVPQPLADLQRSILRFFSNQKKVFEIASDYRSDPIKAILVLQNENQLAGRDLKNLRDELGNIKPLAYKYLGKEHLSILDRLFGVQTAYAAWPVLIDADPANLPNWIIQLGDWLSELADWVIAHAYEVWKWAYTTALRIAVKILIDTFQNQVVNWIAGNGNPKFITDWKGFLSEVADKAAGQALYKLYPALCSNIGPLIRVAVLPVPSIDTSVRCTLTQVVQNLTDFYNSFQNGGWVAYGAALQPQNNFFGGLIMVNDTVTKAAAAAANAAGMQSVASQGFFPITKKTDKCLRSHEEDQVDELGISHGTKTVCDQYQEITTTPGNVVGSTLTSALNWPQNEWVSAQRFEELVAAIINAGINRMIKEGLSALTEASNPAPTDFTNAIPPGVSNPGDLSSLKSSTRVLVNAYQRNGNFKKFQDVSDADSQWLALLPSVTDALNQVASSCPSLAVDAKQKIPELNSLKTSVTAEFLTASANTYGAFQARVDDATSSAELTAMPDQLQNLANIPVDVATAQDRLTKLQNLNANAQTDIQLVPQTDPKAPPQWQCNVPLVDTSVVAPPPPPPPSSGG